MTVLDDIGLDAEPSPPTGRRRLRVATAGSVDDGKSTLIGRLLHDTASLMTDHVAAIDRASERYGDAARLALVTDGLRAEREQGITIDVAYRFFATPARSFVIADTPGHAQYTRNMVTGASTSDVAIVLVDARQGLVDQSRRHLHIATMLGIRDVVVAVNKMDLVDWAEERFIAIADDAIRDARRHAPQARVVAIPVSALHGDNVVTRGATPAWWQGSTLLEHLERLEPEVTTTDLAARLPVQWVVRPHGDTFHDYRGVAGRLTGGTIRVGDTVIVEPSGVRTSVAAIDTFDAALDSAPPGRAITVRLADDVDVSRGDTLVVDAHGVAAPIVAEHLTVDLCWMIDRPLVEGSRWTVKHGTRTVRSTVERIVHEIDVTTLDVTTFGGADADGGTASGSARSLGLNAIGRVRLRLASPLVVDRYVDARETGHLVLVDETTNATAGAAVVVDAEPRHDRADATRTPSEQGAPR
jgi:bifunctional enzyme CysN/CysC